MPTRGEVVPVADVVRMISWCEVRLILRRLLAFSSGLSGCDTGDDVLADLEFSEDRVN